jgi:hypothetical protein
MEREKFENLWGGHSPKVYDGHWLQSQKEWLGRKLSGAVVVADNQFMWGKKNLRNVRFHLSG